MLPRRRPPPKGAFPQRSICLNSCLQSPQVWIVLRNARLASRHWDDLCISQASLDLSNQGRSAGAENYGHPKRVSVSASLRPTGFNDDVQRWLKHRWSAAISRLLSVSGLCWTPQSGFSKPPRAYRQSDSIDRSSVRFSSSRVEVPRL